MNKRSFVVVLLFVVVLSINFSAAHEIDNSTSDDMESDFLASAEETDGVLQADSKISTQIEVKSNTTFDVIDESFKIRLADENGSALSNAKVTFTLSGSSYAKTTDSDGIASLLINLKDGSYNITTKFAGNSKYKSSSDITTITIKNTLTVDEGMSNTQIQKIIDDAKDKNVILFKGKSYSGINLVVEKRLTLLTNVGTVLKSDSSAPAITVKGKKASYTIVNGFNIQSKGDGIVVKDSDFVRIINNDITTESNAIVATGTTYLNITKNNLNKNSKSGIVLANAASTYIFNNNIKSNGATGIEIAKSDKVYIHGNVIESNKKNGISLSKSAGGVNYGAEPKNVYINKNTISKNLLNGILVNNAGNNINIKSNEIAANREDGIAIAHIGSNSIQSNVIKDNWANGIKFFDDYVKPSEQDISYNAIYSNLHMDVEAKDTYYQDTGSRLELGDNWYTDFAGICPKIRSNNIKFIVKQIGDNQFQALFLDSNGNIASLLPDRTLSYTAGNGKSVNVEIKGGAGVFTVDADDGDLIKAIVDNSRRDNTYDQDALTASPINGVTPSYSYPAIPYDGDGGNGDGNGNGNGDGGNANRGNGTSAAGNGQNTANSTHSQKNDPADSTSNPVNDAVQNYDSQVATSSESASESSTGNSNNVGSQSQSVVKQILLEEEDFYRVTGISLIVLLIILTIGFYYRDDIKEMNSKR